MNNCLDLFARSKEINQILEKIEGCEYSLFCSGTTLNHNILLASSILRYKKEAVLFICENTYHASKAYDSFCKTIGFENTCLYMVDDLASTEAIISSNELRQERLNTIKSIAEKKKCVVVTTIEALLRPLLPFDKFKANIMKLETSKEIDINKVIAKLVKCGYERTHTTYKIGDFSVRGEVLDIFPSCYSDPIRINFAFDEIESIRFFDIDTQLTRKESLHDAVIYPMYEIISDISLEEVEKKISKVTKSQAIIEDFASIIENNAFDKLGKYLEYIDKDYVSFIDYLNPNNFTSLYINISDLKKTYDASLNEMCLYYENNYANKDIEFSYLLPFENIIAKIKKKVFLSSDKKGLPQLKIHNIFDVLGYKTYEYQNNIPAFINDLKTNKKKRYITFKSKTSLDLFRELLKENEIDYQLLNDFDSKITTETILIECDNALSYGFFGDYELIDESDILGQGKTKASHYRSVKETTIINDKDDLNPGDIVVHYEYGIGRYQGIKSVELNGVIQDYLKLQYDNMNLLVPMEKITDLEKYIGSEGVMPKLTKIGTNEWSKKKDVVREQLRSIAKELIELQIKRQSMKGHKYQKDSEFQKLFENDFEFEETDDQVKIVKEIKKDMENGVLIDRLICGDVGFGKTEIAMRIAFKTVYEGKQVAFMAPTTILTRQHYHTFVGRFEKYGIKVALLNRLVEPSEQKKVIKGLKDGTIDIVIGTHRLLNDEIQYNDLGLLIIDEEQRFGVVHKEKIKQLKNNINVLTLTATPIPRTLQMAVTGIRTLSLLETPPKDRYPIQTYVIEHNETIIKDAIYREIARNGQVFYLHNRISDLDRLAKRIQKLVPEAKICIGHGKMSREELEDVVSKYIDGEYNVFICTTIIETGIDIPNSNTLIVDDSNRLGLAQMYQIRGRVGRTDRIAYAYFTYNGNNNLTSASEKRLSAIKEFTRIGSGYKIAVRDLAIRGAGDILGREQSGFINSVGIDMYMKLLNEVINKEKGIEEEEKANYHIDVSKHIEREYVSDDVIIIYIHKEINSISSIEDKNKTVEELTNRFGKLSDNVLDYIEERYLESLLRFFHINKVIEAPNLITIHIPKEDSSNLRGEKVLHCAYTISDDIRIEYRNNQYIIKYAKNSGERKWLYVLSKFFEALKN